MASSSNSFERYERRESYRSSWRRTLPDAGDEHQLPWIPLDGLEDASRPAGQTPDPTEGLEEGAATMSAPDRYPEGGFEAWKSVVGGWCLLFVSAGWTNCIGVFQAYYELNELKSLSPSTISWITSLEMFIMFGSGALVGKAFDSFGARWIMAVGSLLHVGGIIMISVSRSYLHVFLSQALCSPIGAGCLFHSGLNSTSTWFNKRRPLAMAIVMSGTSIGGVIIPVIFHAMVPRAGFAWTVRALALLVLVLCVVAQATVRSRIKPTRRSLHFMEFLLPFRDITFLMVSIGAFFFSLGIFVPYNFIVVQAQQAGMRANLAASMIVLLNGGSFFGRILPGFIAGCCGGFNLIIMLMAITTALTLAMWLPSGNSLPALITFIGLFGFFSGGFISLIPALVVQISDITRVGVQQGTFFFVVALATLFGSPVAGAIQAATGGSFWGVQLYVSISLLVGTMFLIAARISLGGWRLEIV